LPVPGSPIKTMFSALSIKDSPAREEIRLLDTPVETPVKNITKVTGQKVYQQGG
jgi:hypothetical protein